MTDRLFDFIARHRHLVALTGAGISTASGIPDYRDVDGAWKHQKPMEYRDFVSSHRSRQRYWSRSYFGWQRFSMAQPNAAHRALAGLERLGRLQHTITQNVDGLHQRAGSQSLTELHGSLASVACIDCGASKPRRSMQDALLRANPQLESVLGNLAPDGDAQLQGVDETRIRIPDCDACGGILKPEVVFFGETVPARRVQRSREAIAKCDALLVIGSSLMVFSGFRFVREAIQQGIPVVAINRGKTRADDLLQAKFDLDCASALAAVLHRFDPEPDDSVRAM